MGLEVKVKYALLCDNALVSSDGKMSIIGVFQVIKCNEFPFVHPSMFFVADMIVKSTSQWKLELIMTKKNKEGPVLKVELDGNKNITEQSGSYNIITQFNMLRFEEAGEYELVANIKNPEETKEIDRISLTLIKT